MINKLKNEFVPNIRKLRKVEGNKLIKKIDTLIHIYMLTPLDLDIFYYKAFTTFE